MGIPEPVVIICFTGKIKENPLGGKKSLVGGILLSQHNVVISCDDFPVMAYHTIDTNVYLAIRCSLDAGNDRCMYIDFDYSLDNN